MNTQLSLPILTDWQEKLQMAATLYEEVLREAPAVYQTGKNLAFSDPEAAAKFCQTKIGFSEREEVLVLFLNSQNQLIQAEVLFQGTINQAVIYAREILKRGLRLNAAAIVVSHNHPSGNVMPSDADRKMTYKVYQACQMVDIKLLDHIIVSAENHYSFLENNERLSSK